MDLSSWTAYFQDFGQFFNAFLFTLALAIGSFILAMVLGTFFGAMSTSKRPILRILARIFVEFYQNTPLLVQFVIVFYGLPLISDHTIMIPIYWTAVLCVVDNFAEELLGTRFAWIVEKVIDIGRIY